MIKVNRLSKAFGSSLVLHDVNFALDKKELLMILGLSGSGKTTLLRLVAGFEQPNAGEIEIDGITVSSRSINLQPKFRNFTMIFQDLALWPNMNVFENIEFPLKYHGLSKPERKERVEKLLDKVFLANKIFKYPHQLSGGEKQRLAIARAIAPKPGYILMDEPFNNLDLFLKEEMYDLTLSLIEEMGVGVIYVTHALEEVLKMANRVTVLNNGCLKGNLKNGELKSLNEADLTEWYKQCLIA